jgi:hypothetical protein
MGCSEAAGSSRQLEGYITSICRHGEHLQVHGCLFMVTYKPSLVHFHGMQNHGKSNHVTCLPILQWAICCTNFWFLLRTGPRCKCCARTHCAA